MFISKEFKRTLVYNVVKIFAALLNSLPRAAALFFGAVLGNLAYIFSRRDRLKAQRNAYLAFGRELNKNQLKTLASKSFINMGKMAVDVIRIRRHYNNQLKNLIDIEGLENLDPVYNKGHGVIVPTGHIGNFELLAVHFARMGYKVGVIGRQLYDPRLDELIRGNREHMGIKVFDTRQSPREMMRWLKDGGMLGVLMDTDSFRVRSMFIPVFGRLSHTPVGQSIIALRTDTPVVPIICLRNGSRYKIKVWPEIKIERTENFEHDVYNLTKECTRIWEKIVKENKDQWIWIHNRWHNRPEQPITYIEETIS
jgi:KDO2-lipid IV(A) lauroyltransferase